MFRRTALAAVALAAALPLFAAHPAAADTAAAADTVATDTPAPTSAVTSSVADYFATWFDRVDAARASQPHWAAPLMTTTPLLIEQVRADAYFEQVANGARIANLGGTKGLELIPTTTNEVFVTFPAYQERGNVKPVDGYTDWQFLLIKQRLLSGNEQGGDYVLTAFLSAQAPTGNAAFTSHAYLITPTLAGGVGFGDFDVQATTSLGLPSAHDITLGTTWATNVAFQYRVATVFWPEVEVNWTHWLDGTQRGGKDQVFLTVGAVVGTIKLTDRLGVAIGAGYQFAVAPTQEIKPVLTPVYLDNWVLSARMPF